MSGGRSGGRHWLDSLARWSVRDEAPTGDGLSRRAVLGTAAGAAAAAVVSGPLRFALPAPARADAAGLAACIKAVDDMAFNDFQACVKDPVQAFGVYQQAIDQATLQLRTSKNRARLLGVIDRSTKGQGRAVRRIEDCNLKWNLDRSAGAAGCQAANPPAAGGGVGGAVGGGGGGVPAPKCDPTQEIQCGDICCNATGHPECCVCPKTGKYQCCANGSNCQCCG
jgi:hypothetical protein